MSKGPWRFFYHYFKAKGKMSVHFREKCLIVDDVKCMAPCQTKWRRSQPRLVMQGFAMNVRVVQLGTTTTAVIL